MGSIILKIPRKKNRVKIFRSDELIDKELSKYYSKEIIEEVQEVIIDEPIIDEEIEKEPEIQHTFFTETFTIKDTIEPIQISFKNVPLNMIHTDIVKVQLQNSYDSGFNHGQEVTAAAYENDLKKLREIIVGFESLTFSLRKQYSKEIELLENSLIPSTIMITEAIIANEISQSSIVLINQLKKAIKEMDDEEIIKVLVNPEDVKTLEEVKGSLLSNKSKSEKIEISADNSVEKGSCVVLTDAGIIDARIKTQLGKIKQNMIDTIEIKSIDDYLENVKED